MKKTIFLFAISFLILSCENQSPKEESTNSSNSSSSKVKEISKIGRTNYAVVWKWTTANTQLVSDNTSTIANELTNLWKTDVVENAYYDVDSPTDKLAYFPNIVFVLKAQNVKEARSILNNLTIVKNGIASYTLYPVGLLWLDRKTDLINKNGITNSFVTVWKTQEDQKPSDKITISQSEKVTELWEAGKIENVYFDVEGTQKKNNKTDFVFFVNANTKEEAEAVCRSLPFHKENLATYEIHQVGVFWMGKFKNQ